MRRMTVIVTAALVICLAASPGWAWIQKPLTPGFPASMGISEPVEESSVLVVNQQTTGKDIDGTVLTVGVGPYLAATQVGNGSVAGVQVMNSGASPTKSSPTYVQGDVYTASSADLDPAWSPFALYLGMGAGADIYDQTNGGYLMSRILAQGLSNPLSMFIQFMARNQDNYDGTERPGDESISPAFSNGFSEGTYSTACAADLNNDGRQEIVYSAWDHNIYVRDALTGDLFNSNWPLNVHDSVWSSPVVVDIDQDGVKDIVASYDTTAGIFDHRNGGRMTVFDHNGNHKAGWPYQIDQTFYSSPAVGDLDGDGVYEIVSGTGSYWRNDGQLRGRYVYCWDPYGHLKWRADIGHVATSSPALADIDNDGKLEVIIGAWDGKIYCLDENGYLQWSTTLYDRDGNSYSNLGEVAAVKASPTVADIDGDGDLEVLVSFLWEVVVLDHNGTQLTGPGSPDEEVYLAYWSLFSSPTVADIDGDDKLEIVVGGGGADQQVQSNGAFWSWETNAPADSARPWWTFHKDANRSGLVPIGG